MDNEPVPTPQYEITQAEKTVCDSGQMIQAIKLVRERTGLGLKEAKDLVFAYRDSNPLTQTVRDLKTQLDDALYRVALAQGLQAKIYNLEGRIEAYQKIFKTLKLTIPKGKKQ